MLWLSEQHPAEIENHTVSGLLETCGICAFLCAYERQTTLAQALQLAELGYSLDLCRKVGLIIFLKRTLLILASSMHCYSLHRTHRRCNTVGATSSGPPIGSLKTRRYAPIGHVFAQQIDTYTTDTLFMRRARVCFG